MASFLQIINVLTNGATEVFHPETNADYVLNGASKEVPTALNIVDWKNRSEELVLARNGKASLSVELQSIRDGITEASILEKIKKVDGSNSGLDSDMIDGRHVNDIESTIDNLWTAHKTVQELNKKVDNTEVVSIAEARKVLRLNENGMLPANLLGNASTATALKKAIQYTFSGDIIGSFSVQGGLDIQSVAVNTAVKDDSHNHTYFSHGSSRVEVKGSGLLDFKKDGVVVSSIDGLGNFSGSASKVGGVAINNTLNKNSLWTSEKIVSEITSEVDKVKITNNSIKKEIQLGENIVMVYGELDLSQPLLKTTFTTPFTTLLSTGHSLECDDVTVVVNKAIGKTGDSSIEFIANKTAEGKLHWNAIGIR